MNANAAKRDAITAPSFSLRRRLLPVLITACFGQAALANPVGPQVINGQVGFNSQGGVLSITNTPGAIINWQSFSINPSELTRFIQQNPNSAVLNRIVGQDPSQILGALQSNGRVFLVNPNGIVFGQGAQIDVNGLVASTLNIGNEDFINGKLNFKAGDKAGNLKNQGAITTPSGGQVYLIAPNVENSGIITSPKGDVMLAAGHTVQLVDSLDPNMQVVLSAPENEALNLGNVIAQGGKTGIYGALIKQRGIVSANSAVVGENGKIVFKASKETILDAGSRTTATGAGKGGEVQVLGERVALAGDAKIDVSGQTGGGTVLVGGDYQGKNAAVSNAKRASLGTDAEIKADALQNGDGGKVIVWSDESTGVYGTITARGGEQGGNGGFVETSGKQKLTFNARVDTRAPMGKAGTLLLDPQDIIIANGSGGADDGLLGDGIIGAAEAGTAVDATISEQTLEGLSGNVTLQASRDVIFNDLTDGLLNLSNITSGSTFTVTAARNITATADLNDRIQTGGGNVSFTTTNGKIDIAGIKSNGGTVTLTAGGTLGDMVVREIVTTPGSGNAGAISLTSSGTSYMTLGGGNIDARGNSGSSGNVVLKSAAPISMQNGKTIYANQLEMEAAGGISDGASNAISTQVTSLHAKNTGTGTIKISNSGGNLSIVDSNLDGYGVKQQIAGQTISITNATGTLDVNAPIVTNNGAVSLTGPAVVNLYAAGDITTAGGSLDLVTSVTGSKISTAVGAQISTTGGTVRLTADKMQLLGTIDAKDASITGSGVVKLAPLSGTLIDVGTADTLDNTARLELNNDELNRISTGVLVLGDTNSGALDIKTALTGGAGGALQNVSKALSLVSGGAVTQQSGAIIGGGSSVKARGTSVTLNEANGTGVIAGEATTGDFQYNSANLLTVSTVDSMVGISSTSGKVFLQSTSTLGINQNGGSKVIAPGGLGIKAIGPVILTDTANDIANVAADLTGGSGNFALYSLNNLTVGGLLTVDAISSSGITTNNTDIAVGVASGKTLTISQPINTGSTTGITETGLKADTLVLNNTVTANMVNIRPVTPGRAITVGKATCIVSASPCLAVFDLYKFVAKTIGIGTDDSSNLPGAIAVQGITDGGASPSLATDRNATTTRIGLLTGGAVTQVNPIIVQDLGVIAAGGVTLSAANQVTNFAARTTNTAVTFTDTTSFDVTTLSGGSTTNNTSYSLSGISTSNGNVTLALNGTSTSQLGIPGQLNAGTGTVTLTSSGSVYGSGTSPDIIGGLVDITANGTSALASTGAIDGAGGLHVKAPRISSLLATNSGINIRGFTGLTLGASSPTAGTAISAPNGTVTITTDSPYPLTVNGDISAGGNISLTAGGGSAEASTGAVLTVNGVVSSTSGTITLAGNSITGTKIPSGTNVVLQTYTPPTTSTPPPTTSTPPPPPTIDQCVANSSLSGCSAVLPTLSACTADPTAAGCSAVLPTVATCTTAPSTAGCTAVLPSVNTCTTAPTTAGCSAVLPTVSTCTAAPSTAGCTAVLPSINTCTAAPSTAGCTVVLPTLSTCTAAPSTAGCSAVLPSISTCTAAPSTSGCASVLPTLSTCTSTPSAAGCSAVLPALSACTATPTLTGCSAVLPTISQCSATPTLAGCEVVVPIASQCTINPSAAGCGTVLPTTQSGQETVTQTVTSNTNTLVNSTSTTNNPIVSQSGGSGGGSSGGGSKPADNGNEKKDEKKTASGPEDNGAKKNEPAKKMYCN